MKNPCYAILAAVLLSLSLPACATADLPAVKPIPVQARQPGYGVVESIREVRVVTAEPSASAGASARPADRPAYRIGVRMADGSLQYRDVFRPQFNIGDNVLLTNAGDVVPD